jgi:hypothetical protein
MAENLRRDWIAETSTYRITCVCERALRAASGIAWQRLARVAAENGAAAARDYFDPSRAIIAEYLRHTGRLQEAAEVEAIGCNEPPPATGFGKLDAAQWQMLRGAMGG